MCLQWCVRTISVCHEVFDERQTSVVNCKYWFFSFLFLHGVYFSFVVFSALKMFDTEKFISLVQEHPYLWDKVVEEYSDRNLREEASLAYKNTVWCAVVHSLRTCVNVKIHPSKTHLSSCKNATVLQYCKNAKCALALRPDFFNMTRYLQLANLFDYKRMHSAYW